MKTKTFSLDIVKLSEVIKKSQFEKKQPADSSVRSTIFSLGSDARVGSLQLTTPDLFLAELLKDALNQLFIRIHWKIPRFDIDSGKIIGFNVYRKKNKTFSDEKLSQNQFGKLTSNLKRNGNFSETQKGVNNVKKGKISLENLNPNLATQRPPIDHSSGARTKSQEFSTQSKSSTLNFR